jgi:hypothetical protein
MFQEGNSRLEYLFLTTLNLNKLNKIATDVNVSDLTWQESQVCQLPPWPSIIL